MFGCNKRLRAIEEELYKKEEYTVGFHGARYEISTAGILERLGRLEAENKKLKAVLAEVVDYVYANLEAKPKDDIISLSGDSFTMTLPSLGSEGSLMYDTDKGTVWTKEKKFSKKKKK